MEIFWASLLISWFFLQCYEYTTFVQLRQDNYTMLVVTNKRILQICSNKTWQDQGEVHITWWPLHKVEFGMARCDGRRVEAEIKTEFGCLRVMPEISGGTLCSLLTSVFYGIPSKHASYLLDFLLSMSQMDNLKSRLNEEYPFDVMKEVARMPDLEDRWLLEKWRPFKGTEKMKYYFSGKDERSCFAHYGSCGYTPRVQWEQILVSNMRLWGSVKVADSVYYGQKGQGGQRRELVQSKFLLFWTPLEFVQNCSIQGVFVSKRNHGAETLLPCWFRTGTSMSTVTVDIGGKGWAPFPFRIYQRNRMNQDRGYLEDQSLLNLRKIFSKIGALNNRSCRSYDNLPPELSAQVSGNGEMAMISERSKSGENLSRIEEATDSEAQPLNDEDYDGDDDDDVYYGTRDQAEIKFRVSDEEDALTRKPEKTAKVGDEVIPHEITVE